jgi:integrase
MKCRSLNVNALELPDEKWTPHDLRRTGATMMGMLGVRPDVIEKCLNHVEKNKVVRIYQRQKLETEQAEAWCLLGDRLDLLCRRDSENVIVPDFVRVA